MVVILCLGSISLLFDGGSEGSGPGTTTKIPCSHRDANDNGACEKCGEIFSDGCDIHRDADDNNLCDSCSISFEDGCDLHRDTDDNKLCDICEASFSDKQDVFGGFVTQQIDFSNGADHNFNFAANKYGTKTYENGYVKLYTTEADEGIEIDNHMSIYLCSSQSAISLSAVDYITVDFDIWTEDELIMPITMLFGNSNGDRFTSGAPKIYKNTEGVGYFTIHGQESYVKLKKFNGTEPIHVTLVISPLKSGSDYYPQICMYLDGERAITTVLGATSDLYSLRFGMGRQTVSANKSVCMDNIQVSTFGDGSGSYDGAIATAFSENGYNLTECIDSVLYNKNN